MDQLWRHFVGARRYPSQITPRPLCSSAVLGNAALAQSNRDAARERAEALRPILDELHGRPLRAIAEELDRRGIATPSGRPWSAVGVMRVRDRLKA